MGRDLTSTSTVIVRVAMVMLVQCNSVIVDL